MIRPVHVLSGDGEPRGEKIPERGRGWGNFSPVEVNGDGDGDFLTPRDGYGKITPDGEIPIAISKYVPQTLPQLATQGTLGVGVRVTRNFRVG
jgi:hypothetical protein